MKKEVSVFSTAKEASYFLFDKTSAKSLQDMTLFLIDYVYYSRKGKGLLN
ncbi:hypothetical protein [Ornithinibacillus bavariensis]|nr:hypothetical protein [Ornithinibacillus bavariensis]